MKNEETKKLIVTIPKNLHKNLKLYCVENDIQIKVNSAIFYFTK